MRVIGVGNPLRGDDAAGLEVARRVAAEVGRRADVRRCSRGAAALLDAWEGADDVVVVDATRSGRRPGTVRCLTADAAAAGRRGGGTHDAGLADALALAGALGRVPRRLRIYGIEGGDFTLGAPLSPAVVAAVEILSARLIAALTAGCSGSGAPQ